MTRSKWLVPSLSLTLIVSWGSLYYAFGVLTRPIQAELEWGASAIVGAYSLALLIAGCGAYPVGKLVDRFGGRRIMTGGSLLAFVLFLCLSQVTTIVGFYLIWAGLGLSMAMALNEPAFAVIVANFPDGYRRRIATLALAGGLSSTTFWPLTDLLVTSFGWRNAALTLGALHLCVCVPLHWFIIPGRVARQPASSLAPAADASRRSTGALRQPAVWLMMVCFGSFGFVTASMAVYAIAVIESRGIAAAAAVSIAALIGPMQIAGRFVDVLFGSRVRALTLGAVTVCLIPAALISMLVFTPGSPIAIVVFVALYGAGVGLMTIVRGTVPAEMFGRDRYATVNGLLAGPGIAARALGPTVVTAVLGVWHSYEWVLGLMLALTATGALCYWIAMNLENARLPRAAPSTNEPVRN